MVPLGNLQSIALFIALITQTAAMFTITAEPGTDMWRKPPSTDVFSAPTASEPEAVIHNALNKFVSATVSFKFTPEVQYDQAGIVLALRPRGAANATGIPPKWIKSGIEFYQGVPRMGTVGTDTWSDWSIAPVATESGSASSKGVSWTTVLVEKHVDELGDSLWVYQVNGEERLPLREINWPFGYGDEWELKVEAYAAKPGSGAPLEVEFKDFAVQWKD
ncbi:hypothetical protein B0I35DRAFT_170990 [Stachybotrys elegans]|uniref:Uncharacterized protein n=1 Tax=Stachybotrys elegans TaxID=80388 RepID=A0A8K0SU50_9HYPO|nr:hypothetical protein B0I35DRAFT_170990 [Stachybotrys elegans]